MNIDNLYHSVVKQCTALIIIITLVFSGCGGGSSSNTKQIANLTASKQTDGTIYYTGSYQGTAIRFAHRGPLGQGLWAIYSGAPGNRIRVTVSDTNGVVEVLSMDGGQRTTINYVGSERIEYRIYSNTGKFLLGSVLYLLGNKWQQGLMFTEAFKGYDNLVSVTDVTAQIIKANKNLTSLVAKASSVQNNGFNFVTPAYASLYDDMVSVGADAVNAARVIRGYAGSVIQTVGFNGLVTMSSIAAVTLGSAETGAVITTVGGAVITGATAVLTVAVAAAPLVAAVAIGCVIGTLASNQSQQSVAIAADGTNSADYNTYSQTSYSNQAYPTVPAPQTGSSLSTITPTPITPESIPPQIPPVTCTSPMVLQNGVCVDPTPTCTSPQVLLNGVCVTPTLPAPTNVNVTNTGGLTWKITFNPVAGADEYYIFQSSGSTPSVTPGHYSFNTVMTMTNFLDWKPVDSNPPFFTGTVSAAGTYTWVVVAAKIDTTSTSYVYFGQPASTSLTFTSAPTCVSPQVLQNGVCVTPALTCVTDTTTWAPSIVKYCYDFDSSGKRQYQGKFEMYYQSASGTGTYLAYSANYANGVLNGTSTGYYEGNILSHEEPYVNGNEVGIAKYYFSPNAYVNPDLSVGKLRSTETWVFDASLGRSRKTEADSYSGYNSGKNGGALCEKVTYSADEYISSHTYPSPCYY